MTFFLQAFVTLFVIIDPPGIVPVFIGLTRGRSPRTKRKLAWQAAVVAFSVIVAFALFGRAILDYTQVGIPALEGAGGLLLLLVSLQLLTGKTEEPSSTERAKANVAFVPLSTPLLAGPGGIVATIAPGPASSGVPSGTNATLLFARSAEVGSSVFPVSSCRETSRSSSPPAPSSAAIWTCV